MPYAFCILVSALLVTYTRHLTVTPFAVVHDTVVLPVLLAVIFPLFSSTDATVGSVDE